MELTEIGNMIRADEGYSSTLYLDTEGILTGGYGHAFILGSELPFDVCNKLLWHDIRRAYERYETLGLTLSENREAVVINMIFNLGLRGFSTFKRMIAAIKKEDWEKAADEILDSKYAGQVKGRADRLSKMMRHGISYQEV